MWTTWSMDPRLLRSQAKCFFSPIARCKPALQCKPALRCKTALECEPPWYRYLKWSVFISITSFEDRTITFSFQISEYSMKYPSLAKVVDMKDLKRCSLALIKSKQRINNSIPFDWVYAELPTLLTQRMTENLSHALAFFAVLHLCNEHGFQLVKNSTNPKSFLINFPKCIIWISPLAEHVFVCGPYSFLKLTTKINKHWMLWSGLFFFIEFILWMGFNFVESFLLRKTVIIFSHLRCHRTIINNVVRTVHRRSNIVAHKNIYNWAKPELMHLHFSANVPMSINKKYESIQWELLWVWMFIRNE